MERVYKWLLVVQVVLKVLAAALAAVAVDTAVGEPLRGVVHRAAAFGGLHVAAAEPVSAPSVLSLSLLVLRPSEKAMSSV